MVCIYGVTQNDGANFSFSINNGPSQSCTSWRNDTFWTFQVSLCTIAGLDAATQHTLTVKHTDVSGRWLYLDFLE